MPRGITKGSIRSTEDGFARISIGNETHKNLKELARVRETSMAACIRDMLDKELSGGVQSKIIDPDKQKTETVLKNLVNVVMEISTKLDTTVFNAIGMGEKQGYHERELTPESISREIKELSDKVSELARKSGVQLELQES